MSYLTWICFTYLLATSEGKKRQVCEDENSIVNGAGIAAYGTCAAVGGVFCGITFGIGCIAALACGSGAAVHAGLEAASGSLCDLYHDRKKRSAERDWLTDGNTDEMAQYLENIVVKTSNKKAINEAAVWTVIENLEDTAVGALDNIVQNTVVKEAIRHVRKVDKVYKSLKKTKLLHLFKEKKDKITSFGDMALNTKKQNNDLVTYLSGNNTMYKQTNMCNEDVIDGAEALILKLGGFYFMGVAIIENRVPSTDEIDDLKEKLVANEVSYMKHCN